MTNTTTIEERIFNMALHENKVEVRRLLASLSKAELDKLSDVVYMLLDEIDLQDHKPSVANSL